MIRPFRDETERYGEYTKSGEVVYDHPFQFGSKRTGPDLAREGVKSLPNYKPDSWHYSHIVNPQQLSPESIMPQYPWLAENEIDLSVTPKKINVMRTLGVPYPEGYEDKAVADLQVQYNKIANGLRDGGIDVGETRNYCNDSLFAASGN